MNLDVDILQCLIKQISLPLGPPLLLLSFKIFSLKFLKGLLSAFLIIEFLFYFGFGAAGVAWDILDRAQSSNTTDCST